MPMSFPTTKLTYHDYLLLPEDRKRYEILDGDLFMTPAPLTRHQLIAIRLSHILMAYFETHPLGTVLAAPCDVLLSESDVVQPDLLVVLENGQAHIMEKNIQGPPDMIIEILSPSTAARDRELKRKRYEYFGVREYWLVDPENNSLEILKMNNARFVLHSLSTAPSSCSSSIIPHLTLDLAWLFH